MSGRKNQTVVIVLAVTLIMSFTASPALMAQEWDEAYASADAMLFDLVLVRPIGLAASVAGQVLFVVSLPFTLLGGNVGEAAKELSWAPVKYTFARPLGKFEEDR
jgi:NAD dependent epimerase/dehydratase family enzyme